MARVREEQRGRLHVCALLALVTYTLLAVLAQGTGWLGSVALGLTLINWVAFLLLLAAPRAGAVAFWWTSLLWFPVGLLGMYGAARLVEEHNGFDSSKLDRALLDDGVKRYFIAPRERNKLRGVGYACLAFGVFTLFRGSPYSVIYLGGAVGLLLSASWQRTHARVQLRRACLVFDHNLFRPRQVVPYSEIQQLALHGETLEVCRFGEFSVRVPLRNLDGAEHLKAELEEKLAELQPGVEPTAA